MLGAKLILEGVWMETGRVQYGRNGSHPFYVASGSAMALPWHEEINPILPHEY